ncbi:MAG: cation transporter [Ignavibacteriales bacterium]|nr:cation transporter [Ignavibacteriales bacterium]
MTEEKLNSSKDKLSKFADIGIKTTIVGIIVSIILAALKAIAGVLGNSYALIADAIESTSDVFTSIIVLTGLKIAKRPADKTHPYGHGKAEPFAGIIVSSALFIAAIIIIFQSIHEIITPHHSPAPFTLIVLIAVVIIKEMLFRFVIKAGNSLDSVAVKNEAWHHRSDAITSGAVFIGITIALIGGPGYEQADDYAALCASLIIIFNALRLFKPALYEIMDTAPSPEIINKVIETSLSVDGVIAIDKCFARKMGFQYYVDMHVIVDGNITVYTGHEISHSVKNKIINSFPNISDVLIHIEPDTPERLSRENIIVRNSERVRN